MKKVSMPTLFSFSENVVAKAEAARREGHKLYVSGQVVRDALLGLPVGCLMLTTSDDISKQHVFTCDALLYDILAREVVDNVGGIGDIENGIVRMIGDPDVCFRDDGTRVLDALCLASRFGWTIEETVAGSIRRCCDGRVLSTRTRDALVDGLLTARTIRSFIGLLDEFGVWQIVFPGLKVTTSPDTLVSSSGVESRNVPVVLAVLLDDNQPDDVFAVLTKQRYHELEIKQVMFLMQFRDLDLTTAYELRWRQRGVGLTDEDLIEYAVERGLPSHKLLRMFISCKHVDLEHQTKFQGTMRFYKSLCNYVDDVTSGLVWKTLEAMCKDVKKDEP